MRPSGVMGAAGRGPPAPLRIAAALALALAVCLSTVPPTGAVKCDVTKDKLTMDNWSNVPASTLEEETNCQSCVLVYTRSPASQCCVDLQCGQDACAHDFKREGDVDTYCCTGDKCTLIDASNGIYINNLVSCGKSVRDYTAASGEPMCIGLTTVDGFKHHGPSEDDMSMVAAECVSRRAADPTKPGTLVWEIAAADSKGYGLPKARTVVGCMWSSRVPAAKADCPAWRLAFNQDLTDEHWTNPPMTTCKASDRCTWGFYEQGTTVMRVADCQTRVPTEPPGKHWYYHPLSCAAFKCNPDSDVKVKHPQVQLQCGNTRCDGNDTLHMCLVGKRVDVTGAAAHDDQLLCPTINKAPIDASTYTQMCGTSIDNNMDIRWSGKDPPMSYRCCTAPQPHITEVQCIGAGRVPVPFACKSKDKVDDQHTDEYELCPPSTTHAPHCVKVTLPDTTVVQGCDNSVFTAIKVADGKTEIDERLVTCLTQPDKCEGSENNIEFNCAGSGRLCKLRRCRNPAHLCHESSTTGVVSQKKRCTYFNGTIKELKGAIRPRYQKCREQTAKPTCAMFVWRDRVTMDCKDKLKPAKLGFDVNNASTVRLAAWAEANMPSGVRVYKPGGGLPDELVFAAQCNYDRCFTYENAKHIHAEVAKVMVPCTRKPLGQGSWSTATCAAASTPDKWECYMADTEFGTLADCGGNPPARHLELFEHDIVKEQCYAPNEDLPTDVMRCEFAQPSRAAYILVCKNAYAHFYNHWVPDAEKVDKPESCTRMEHADTLKQQSAKTSVCLVDVLADPDALHVYEGCAAGDACFLAVHMRKAAGSGRSKVAGCWKGRNSEVNMRSVVDNEQGGTQCAGTAAAPCVYDSRQLQNAQSAAVRYLSVLKCKGRLCIGKDRFDMIAQLPDPLVCASAGTHTPANSDTILCRGGVWGDWTEATQGNRTHCYWAVTMDGRHVAGCFDDIEANLGQATKFKRRGDVNFDGCKLYRTIKCNFDLLTEGNEPVSITLAENDVSRQQPTMTAAASYLPPSVCPVAPRQSAAVCTDSAKCYTDCTSNQGGVDSKGRAVCEFRATEWHVDVMCRTNVNCIAPTCLLCAMEPAEEGKPCFVSHEDKLREVEAERDLYLRRTCAVFQMDRGEEDTLQPKEAERKVVCENPALKAVGSPEASEMNCAIVQSGSMVHAMCYHELLNTANYQQWMSSAERCRGKTRDDQCLLKPFPETRTFACGSPADKRTEPCIAVDAWKMQCWQYKRGAANATENDVYEVGTQLCVDQLVTNMREPVCVAVALDDRIMSGCLEDVRALVAPTLTMPKLKCDKIDNCTITGIGTRYRDACQGFRCLDQARIDKLRKLIDDTKLKPPGPEEKKKKGKNAGEPTVRPPSAVLASAACLAVAAGALLRW